MTGESESPQPPPPLEAGAPPGEAPGSPPPPPPPPGERFAASLFAVTPRLRVVPALVAVNAAIFAVMLALGSNAMAPVGDPLLEWGSNFGPRTLGGQPWRLLTNAFLHFGAVHLAMNMLALWDAGRLVERIYGHGRFLALYLAAALGGSVASVATHPQVTSVGASGAVFGVYGALAVFVLRQRGSIPAEVVSRLARVAVFFVGYNTLYSFRNPSIDVAAHLGGLAAGAVAGLLLVRPLVPGREERAGPPLIAVALAVALAGLAVRALPTPPDLQAVVQRFAADEKRLLAELEAVRSGAAAAHATNQAFADALQSRVIGPWREARLRLSAPAPWLPKQRELLDLLGRYAQAREAAWTALAAASRRNDEALLKEFKAREEEAAAAIEELKRLQGPAPQPRPAEKYELPK
jgi:rhomboid protease GluP